MREPPSPSATPIDGPPPYHSDGGACDSSTDASRAPASVTAMVRLFEPAHACRMPLPAHIERWVRTTEWHLRRILENLPDPIAGFPDTPTDARRWHLEGMTLGPKLEVMALKGLATAEERKWTARLGSELRRARAMLPPSDFATFLAWDPQPLPSSQ